MDSYETNDLRRKAASRCDLNRFFEPTTNKTQINALADDRINVTKSKKIRNIVVPDECLKPVFSYHFADSGAWPDISPVFGCFISSESVYLHRPESHGEGGTVQIFPLPSSAIPDDFYCIISKLKEDRSSTVCPGGWGVPGLPRPKSPCVIYSAYEDDGYRRTLQIEDGRCWYINRMPGAVRLLEYIDDVCRPLLRENICPRAGYEDLCR